MIVSIISTESGVVSAGFARTTRNDFETVSPFGPVAVSVNGFSPTCRLRTPAAAPEG